MKLSPLIFLIFILFSCSPKGPQTYSSPWVGKTKNELIREKGVAKKIKVFSDSEAYIYTVREAYYGKKNPDIDENVKPKKMVDIEHIYYINSEGIIYKYQVWEKKVPIDK